MFGLLMLEKSPLLVKCLSRLSAGFLTPTEVCCNNEMTGAVGVHKKHIRDFKHKQDIDAAHQILLHLRHCSEILLEIYNYLVTEIRSAQSIIAMVGLQSLELQQVNTDSCRA
jgi:hypothetical protein